MISQFAVMNFGYSNPKIMDATVSQIRKSPLINTGFINLLYGEFADRITKARSPSSPQAHWLIELRY